MKGTPYFTVGTASTTSWHSAQNPANNKEHVPAWPDTQLPSFFHFDFWEVLACEFLMFKWA